MQCSFCRQSIERALARLPGVAFAAVNLAHEEALVGYDGSPAVARRVGETLRALGYTIRDRERLQAFVQAEEELDEERRWLLVAALLAGVGLTMLATEWLSLPIAVPWLGYAMGLGAPLLLFLGRLSSRWRSPRSGAASST